MRGMKKILIAEIITVFVAILLVALISIFAFYSNRYSIKANVQTTAN